MCGFNYLWYQLGGPVAAAWRVESYLRPVGWYGSHALLVWHLGGSFFDTGLMAGSGGFIAVSSSEPSPPSPCSTGSATRARSSGSSRGN